jgi:hypothetical protein
MTMRDTREVVDALHYLNHQDLILFMGLPLIENHQLNGLGQRLMPFGQPIQPLIDRHTSSLPLPHRRRNPFPAKNLVLRPVQPQA